MTPKTAVSQVNVMQWKLVAILACCLFFVALGAGVGAADSGGPDCDDVEYVENGGTYEVENLSQLQCIEEHGLEEDYVLVEDIDANETEDWNKGDGFEPIGDSADNWWTEGNETFNGTFDGNDRTIANLTIDRDEADFVGLFGVIGSEGTVSDLTLESATVEGNDWTGGLSGQNWGTVSNLTLESATVTGNDDVGGLIGENRGTVSDVSMSTDVAGSGKTGGVIGNNFGGTITGATVEGTVFSKQDVGLPRVGGIVGHHHSSSSIDSSSFTNGTVDGENENIGGIAGYADGSPITNSSANGTVGNEDADSVGGLAGRHFGDLSDSYSTATVRGNDTVGGVIGDAVESDIERTYAVGEVDGDGDDVGSLVGIGKTGIGYNFNIENSYWDTETTGVSESFDSDEGGLTTDEMTGADATEHMDGFGFPDGDDRWHAVEDDYPALEWEDTDPVYGVEITSTNSAIEEGETLEVDATVTNVGSDGDKQSIELQDFDGDEVDTEEVTLESGESTDLTLEWETEEGEGDLDDVAVVSENHTDTRTVSIGAGEVVPQCQPIDTDGAYELIDDIEASDDCIEIQADDVSLDGNDHTISGNGTGIVVNDHSNVTITNVTLSGLDVGIEMTALEDATVKHNTVEGSVGDGVVFEDVHETTIANNTVTQGATNGIHLADAADTTVENNTLRENDESGMYIVNSEELVVSENEVVDNGEDDEDELSYYVEDAGIYFSGTTDSTLEANNLTANAQAALFLEEESTDNEILGNVVDVSAIVGGDDWRGIKIDDSPENTVSDSVITGSELADAGDPGDYFIYVDSAETVVKDNEIDGHAYAGIDVRGESNTVDNNTIAGSFIAPDDLSGHAIRVSGTGDDWSVTNNSLTNAEILTPERAGIAITGDQTVEIQNNTGTKLDGDLTREPGTDLELTFVEQSVENQQITTPAGDTTLTFTGAGLRLDGVDDPPNAASPDDIESTGYYFEVDNTSDEFTFENLEFDYNETLLTTGDTIDPETLSLWRLDDEWEEIDDSGVDTDEQVVTGNVTEDGTIGVFGEQAFADGNGSADDPFVIEDWDDLDNVRLTPTSNFTLANDLYSETDGYDDVAAASANDGAGFEPIDDFEGTFDGDGATISDLQIDRSDESDVGLFGSTGDSATIDNVHLENATVSGESNVGGLVGSLEGTVSSSSTNAAVAGKDGVGGLVGENAGGDVTATYVIGDVSGDDDVGGLVGHNTGEGAMISQAYAVGDVTGDERVGGLVGTNGGDITASYWDVEATGQDDSDGGTPLSTAEMTGANATEYMDGFAFPDDDGTWHATDSYPVFAWEDTDPFFGVQITETNSPIDQGDTLEVTADVTNWGADGEEQTIELRDFDGDIADIETVTLESGESDEVTLAWETEVSDVDTGDVTVASENDADSEGVRIKTGIDSMTATIDDDEEPTVVVDETLAVTVTAEDENGDPVEGEELSVDEIDGGGDDVTVDGLEGETATTDSDGVVTFEGVTFSGALDATVDVTVSAVDGTEDVMTVTIGGFAEGDGSAADPYVITDWYHLDNVRLHLDGAFELGGTLDEETDGYDDVASETANDGDGFEPIGECNEASACDPDYGASPFSGTFDGNDTEISGLVINSENPENGLFGAAGGATIENVRLHDIDIDIDTADDFPKTGGIVGMMTDSELTRSSVTGEIVSAQDSETGVGGLVGENWGGTIEQSYANTTVTGGDDQFVGGLVGFNFDDTLFHGKGSISDSYATGDVSGGADTSVRSPGTGGLVGVNSGDISNSYATGDVDADENVGGLVGANSGDITSSYWDDQAATVTEDGEAQDGQGVGDGGGNVAGLTTSEMTGDRADDNMAFDFADTWAVVDEPENGNEVSYPFLQTTTQEPAPGLQTRFADGNGSADDPYVIEDWEHLDNVRANLDANVTLANDLDSETDGYDDVANESANDGDGFEPIGENLDAFEGSFDGDGHTVSDLDINRSGEQAVGLFGQTEGTATVDDVQLENATVRGESNVGGIVGNSQGESITNVTATVDIEAELGEGSGEGGSQSGIGGLVGSNNAHIENVSVEGAVSAENAEQVGGVVGYSSGLGGGPGTITDSHANVSVDAEDSTDVGGLVGNADSYAEVDRSSASGTVEGGENVGGLVGVTQSDIDDSFATGTVNGTLNVGGLLGSNDNGIVRNATASSSVEGEENVGGLVGSNQENEGGGVLSETFATGSVDAEGTVGGLVGEDAGSVENSYWDVDATNQSESGGGDPLTTAEMTGLNTTEHMDGFEFPDSWHVTDDYPALEWEDTDPYYAVNLTDTNSPITEGDTLEVATTVTNWAADGEQSVELLDDEDDQQDTEVVALETGNSDELTLEWDTDVSDAGTGNVTVSSENDADSVEVTVEEGSEPIPVPPPHFDVTITDVNETVTAGEPVELEAVVTNLGGWAATQSIELAVDGESVTETSRSITSGGDESVTFSYDTDADDVGELEVVVSSDDDADSATVTVVDDEWALEAYANEEGVIDTDGLRAAIDDWRSDDLETDQLRTVIDAWRSGEVVA